MKKCLKCNKEYEDSDNFCPRCGEKLVQTNVCQKCGHPVATEDIFCRHCGHKIEKEYRCEKCNAIIPEGAKFCSECGESVKNPVVSIVSKKATQRAATKLDKILFYAINAVCITLLLLMFVGCFGDIAIGTTTGLREPTSKTSISYFFGDAIKSINQTNLKYIEYKVFSIIMLVIEYFCWALAIASIVLGVIFISIKMYKSYKNNDYVVNNKLLILPAIGVIPYLSIFGLITNIHLDAYSDGQHYLINMGFGWGLMMIFVSLIIFFSLFAGYKMFLTIFYRKNIVIGSTYFVSQVALFVLFVIAIGQVVSINYSAVSSGSTATVTGYLTPYSIFTSNLSAYSAGQTDKFPSYCTSIIIALGLIFIGTIFGSIFFEKLFSPRKLIPLYIFGGLMLGFMLTGYIMSISSLQQYLKNAGSVYGVASQAFKISIVGVIFAILAIVSIVTITVLSKIKSEKTSND